MIIDAHNHPDWHGHNLDKFLDNMGKNNIDVTWLLSWDAPMNEYSPSYLKVLSYYMGNGAIPFERCLNYKERAPEKFVLGYCPDPRKPDGLDKLKAAVEIYGVKVCGELKLRMMYDNPDAIRMFRYCGEKGLPVTVHIDYEFPTGSDYPRPNWWYGGGIEAFERAVAKCPETIFLGHAPGFWSHISNDGQYNKVSYPKGKVVAGGKVLKMLDQYSNLYCDMSAGSGCNAFSRDPEFGKEFIIKYQDRLLYARDDFNSELQDFINTLDLSTDVLDKIYYKNAIKLVPLD